MGYCCYWRLDDDVGVRLLLLVFLVLVSDLIALFLLALLIDLALEALDGLTYAVVASYNRESGAVV